MQRSITYVIGIVIIVVVSVFGTRYYLGWEEAGYAQRVSDFKLELEDMGKENRTLKNDIEAWTYRANSANVKVGILEDKLDAAKLELDAAEKSINDGARFLSEALKREEAGNQQKIVMSDKIDQLEQNTRNQESLLRDKDAQLATIRTALTRSKSELEAVNLLHQNLTEDLLKAEKKNLLLSEQQSESIERLQLADATSKTQAALLAQYEDEVQKLKASVKAKSDELASITVEYTNASQSAAALSEQLTLVMERTGGELETLRNSLNSVTQLRDTQADIISSRDGTIRDLSDRLESAQLKNIQLQDSLRLTQSELAEANSKLVIPNETSAPSGTEAAELAE